MSHRPRENHSIEELLDDVAYLWEAQGPAGQNRGVRAVEELLYRWDYLSVGHFEFDHRPAVLDVVGMHPAVATIAQEAADRGYNPKEYGLVLQDYES